MGYLLLNFVMAISAACLTHEGGHYLAALCFGKRIRFRFKWGWLFGVIPVPRGVWTMPWMEQWKQRIIALAGFGVELTCAVLLIVVWPWLWFVAGCHLLVYPFYAGDASDFKWL